VFSVVADIMFSDGKVSSYLHVGNIVYTVLIYCSGSLASLFVTFLNTVDSELKTGQG